VTPLVARELRLASRSGSTATAGLQRPSDAELARLREAVRRTAPEHRDFSAVLFCQSGERGHGGCAVAELDLLVGVASHLAGVPEYERTSTVVVNAYLQPLMQSYMEGWRSGCTIRGGDPRLEKRETWGTLSVKNARYAARIFVMQSSGGITALESPLGTGAHGVVGSGWGLVARRRCCAQRVPENSLVRYGGTRRT